MTETDDLPSSGKSKGTSPPRSHSTASPIVQDDLLGQLVAERYRVIELLGSGGMGSVYRAEHVHMRKSVAFKLLHRELTHLSDIVARFEREAIAAARITHPNVAAATDFGRLPDGACYLVLEYVQGKSLRQCLLLAAPFDADRVLRIAKQIALALGAAHEAGIVHRDLKPENVMLVDGTAEPDFVKVLDFGIAKIHMPEQEGQPALTRMGTIFGTPEYMSPEQALGQSADARTDLYSLGIIIYEMLTGRTPFADKELVAVLTRQMTDMPPPLPVEINPSIVALVTHLLAKRPSERPQTAQEVVSRIDTILSLIGHHQGATDASESMNRIAAHSNSSTLDVNIAVSKWDGGAPIVPKQSLPPWLRKSIRVGQHRIPLAIVLPIALAVAVVALLIISIVSLVRPFSATAHSSAAPGTPSTHSAAPAPKRAPAPDPLIKLARMGDAAALRELETRSSTDLDAEHWAAIARGRARSRYWAGMLEAYGHALDKSPSLLRDEELIGDVRSATVDATSSASALRFAAERLASRGADIIYDAWAGAASGRSIQVDTKVAKKLLDDPQLRKVASKPLSVALELVDAHGCGDYRRALAKVISDGDERCLRTLRRVTYDRGCGLFGLGDCYACLRGNNSLAQAIEAAKSRPAPAF